MDTLNGFNRKHPMKSLVLFSILFLSQLSHSQWYEQASGVSSQLADVGFLNDNEGYAVGNSKILKTSDGGTNWSISYDCSYILESITFTQNKTHIVGHNISTSESMYLKSFDNGASWIETVLPTAGVLSDIFFPSNLIGYTIGSQGILLKTVDGGNSWNPYGTGISSMIEAIYFHDDSHGFAVGGFSGGYMYETLDGGSTWNEISVAATTFLQSITFSSASVGYTVGWDGDIFKTTDGGANWSQQTPVAVYGNLDVCFTDDNTGYIVGGQSSAAEIQKTTDGGNTWTSQSIQVNHGLISIHFPSSNNGFAVGASGTILNTSNAGGVGIYEIESSLVKIEVYPNPCVNNFEIKMSSNAEEVLNIDIISDIGKIVYSQPYLINEAIDVSHLKNGVYLVRINFQGHTLIKKLYKK